MSIKEKIAKAGDFHVHVLHNSHNKIWSSHKMVFDFDYCLFFKSRANIPYLETLDDCTVIVESLKKTGYIQLL